MYIHSRLHPNAAMHLSADFQKFNFLLLGLGNMFWVPIAVKFGKRASLIISMALLFAVLCWTAKAASFNSLLASRCISGFAAAAGEVSNFYVSNEFLGN